MTTMPDIRGVVDSRWRDTKLGEILDGLRWGRTWMMLAWFDVLTRYRRSFLGPFWLTLSGAIFVAMLGILYSSLFKMEIGTYLPYVTAGMLAWTFISTTILEGCVVFIESEGIIKNTRLPFTVFVYRVALRNIIVFLHNVPILIVVLALFDVPIRWTILLSPLSLIVYWINAVWLILLLGTLVSRFRDIQPLIASILQVVFFVTPVFWSPDLLGNRAVLADVNVIYHFVELLRAPILGKLPSMLTLSVVAGTTIVGWGVTVLFYHRFRSRIPYWL